MLNSRASAAAAPAPPVTTMASRISIAPQPFWPNNPELWFLQLEDQWYGDDTITDKVKATTVLRSLSCTEMEEITDVLRSAQNGNRYEQLKKALITRFTSSQTQRMRQLLEGEAIGDRTPSQFLRHLQRLAGNNASDEMLTAILMKQLPTSTQAVLSILKHDTPEQLAEAADKAQEVWATNHCSAVQATQPTPVRDELQPLVEKLIQEIRGLRADLATSRRHRSQSRHRSANSSRREPSRQTAAQPTAHPDTHRLCYYHARFGAASTRCAGRCSYQAGNANISQ